MNRYAMAVVGALSGLALLAGMGPASAAGPQQRWELRWNPNPATQGVNAFEFLEDDRRGSDPEGTPHITADKNLYRFTMHVYDRDGSDRQRNEVRGMRTRDGRKIEIRKDETWRLSYQMYIPDTLDATTAFTHIWQMKTPDTSNPLAQISLPILNGVPSIQARYWDAAGAIHEVGSTALEPIQNKWVSSTLEFKSSDDGYMRWVLKEGNRTLVDEQLDHTDLWVTDEQYNRPKWGIYRSINSAGLQDTYLLIKNLQAWQLGKAAPPPVNPPPDRSPGAYEAERVGNIWEGAAEPARCAVCSGGQKVLLTGGNTYDYMVVKGVLSDTTATKQLTIHALVDGTQTFFVSVNGANAIEVPMTGTKGVVTTATVPVPLIAGVNNLRFFNLTARTPELDKVVIS
jgi:hypothetical protein